MEKAVIGILLVVLLVACVGVQFGRAGERGSRGVLQVAPEAPQQIQQLTPQKTVGPIDQGPTRQLSIPGSRAGARGCVDKAGQPCNRNPQCGGTGVFSCTGVCNAPAPNVPSNLGSACGCGGVIQCSGACTSGGCASGSSCQNGVCVAPPCTDTDGGQNYAVQGTTTGYVQTSYGKSSYPLTRTDYCESNNRLHEYYCSYGYVGPGATEIYSIEGIAVCPCQNGHC